MLFGLVFPGLSLNNLKVLKTHKSREKYLYTRKINISVNFYNPELALTGFRTTRP